ncbi:MAG: cysteine desulfurase family protein [Frankia sp.]
MAPYLDHASTAPLHPVAREALLAALDEGWADPARLYSQARRARMLLDAARETVAAALGARPDEVSFTSSGTQAAQLAVGGGLLGRSRAGSTLLVSAVEHSCILHAAERHEAGGGAVIHVPVDHLGRVTPADYSPGPGTALASLQHANHEVGTVQPVAAVAAVLRGDRPGGAGSTAGGGSIAGGGRDAMHTGPVPLHVDAAMSVGRIPVDLRSLGADLLTASAHKFGGPPGVGFLVVRTGTRWRSPLPPDDREGGRVPGFVNLPAVVAAAAALHARTTEMAAEARELTALVDLVRHRVPALVPDTDVLGDPDPAGRLPHLVTFSCLYVDGEALLRELDRAGIAVNSGSSCTSSTLAPSHVLAAMGALTHGNVRVSFGRGSTKADAERLLAVLPTAVEQVRAATGGAGL